MNYGERERLNDVKFRATEEFKLMKDKFGESMEKQISDSQRLISQIGKLEQMLIHLDQLTVHSAVDDLHREELFNYLHGELQRKREAQHKGEKNFDIFRMIARLAASAIPKIAAVNSELELSELVSQTMEKVNAGLRELKI